MKKKELKKLKPETSEDPVQIKKIFKIKLSLSERVAPFQPKKPSVNPDVQGLSMKELLNELHIGTKCREFNTNFENYYQLARKNPVPKSNPALKNLFEFNTPKNKSMSCTTVCSSDDVFQFLKKKIPLKLDQIIRRKQKSLEISDKREYLLAFSDCEKGMNCPFCKVALSSDEQVLKIYERLVQKKVIDIIDRFSAINI